MVTILVKCFLSIISLFKVGKALKSISDAIFSLFLLPLLKDFNLLLCSLCFVD